MDKRARHTRKIVSEQKVGEIAAKARKSGKRIVTTNGCFDIVHVGHVRNLAHAKSLGDVLFVGINSDASVRRNKGSDRPIVPARERAEMLSALESVDHVFIFSSLTPIPWIRKIKPHVHVKGSDRALENGKILEADAVERFGGRVELFPRVGGHSTTNIINRIRALRTKES